MITIIVHKFITNSQILDARSFPVHFMVDTVNY